ncbi:MAG: hypothetical protein Kow0029_17790 [Candidatus Rifleibacteriota bacterium]
MHRIKDFMFGKKLAKIPLLGIIVPIALISLTEIGIRTFSPGYPTTLFIKEHLPNGNEIYRTNYLAAKRFFAGNLARKPLSETFLAKKPANGLRIFILGESAARGEFLADFSFARMLEAVLKKQLPEKTVEVINTGIPAINSWVIKEFAGEIAGYNPDFVIVYAGHNEFIGPYGPGSVFKGNTGRIAAKLGIFASSLHLVQKLKSENLPNELSNGWKGLEMFLANTIQPDDPKIEDCRKNWELNLEEILHYFDKTKLLVCNVPSNLADFPPFMSKPIATNSRNVVEKLEMFAKKSQFQEFTELYEQNSATLKDHALTNYLLGRILQKKGETDKALKAFIKARDLDIFRARTSTTFNETTKNVAARYGATFIDMVKAFLNASRKGITGNDLIYDHVHLTEKGHYLAAKTIFFCLSEKLPSLKSLPFPAYKEVIGQIGLTDHARIFNQKNIIASMKNKPFSFQFNHNQRIAELEAELKMLEKSNNVQADLETLTDAYRQFPDSSILPHQLGLIYTTTGRYEEALAYYTKAFNANPFNIDILNNLASLYLSGGNIGQAESLLNRAIQLAPNFADGCFNLGLCKSKKGDTRQAIKYYEKALSIEPLFPPALRNLANIYFNQKKYQQAAGFYAKAYSADPSDFNSLLGQANCLSACNKTIEAMKIYEQAVKLFDNGICNYSLGLAHEKRKDYQKALDLYLKAMEIDNFSPAAERAMNLLLQPEVGISHDFKEKLATEACRVTGNEDPYYMQILAAIFAEAGKLAEAKSTLHAALEKANKMGKVKLARDIEDSLRAIASSEKE